MTDSFTKTAPDQIEASGLLKAADLVTRSNISLREKLAVVLLALFGGAVACTYVLIFLWGFKVISLPNAFGHWLGAATAGQTASLLLIIVRDLFPAHKRQ